MTDETLEKTRKVEEESIGDVFVNDCFSTDEKQRTLGVIERAQKLEHDERRLRLEESKQKLEAEKFEYQKKQDKRDTWTKIGLGVLGFVGTVAPPVAKLIAQRVYVKEDYQLEQLGHIVSSQTARSLIKDGTNPKI